MYVRVHDTGAPASLNVPLLFFQTACNITLLLRFMYLTDGNIATGLSCRNYDFLPWVDRTLLFQEILTFPDCATYLGSSKIPFIATEP